MHKSQVHLNIASSVSVSSSRAGQIHQDTGTPAALALGLLDQHQIVARLVAVTVAAAVFDRQRRRDFLAVVADHSRQ